MTPALQFSTGPGPGGAHVLAVAGEIDMSNAATFNAALAEALAEEDTVVVDLTSVEYLDSAGLSVLFTHASRIRLVAKPLLRPVLTLSGLDELTSVSIN